jgi:hypothetical protein
VLISCSTITVAISDRYGRKYCRSNANNICVLSHIERTFRGRTDPLAAMSLLVNVDRRR